MKNKKGFTLIELLAVIVILGVIMTIATTSVLKNINESKKKAKYIAAKEIVEIAEAYMAAEGGNLSCVNVEDMVAEGYLESDVTNPKNGENRSSSNKLTDQEVCKEDVTAQDNYEVQANNRYNFDGYYYKLQ